MADDLGARWGRAASPWRLVGLIIGSLVLFAPSRSVGFLSDDYDYLSVFGDDGPSWAWLVEPTLGGHLRPVMWSTVWANQQVVGLEPWAWRAVNVVGHGVVAWLVGLLAFELLRTDPLDQLPRRVVAPVPLLASVVFVVAPTHVEPVVWIIARVDLVWGIPALVALWAWVRDRRVGGGCWRWASVGAFVLAIYAKDSAMAVPAVVLAYELWLPRGGQRWRTSLRQVAAPLLGLGAATIAYFAHRVLLDRSYLSTEAGALDGEPPLLVARRGLQVMARSVVPGTAAAGLALALVVAAVVAVLGLAAWRHLEPSERARARRPAWRLAGFLVTSMALLAAPVARLGVGVDSSAGERLAYVPSALAAIAVASLLALVVAVLPRVGAALVATVVVCSVVGLLGGQQDYVRAGSLADAVVDDLGRLPTDRTAIVLASPDSLDGIWVGRDGLRPALEVVHGWERLQEFHELSGVALDRADAEVTVEPGRCERCVVLRIEAGGGTFIDAPGLGGGPLGTAGQQAEVRRLDDRSVEIELPEGVAAADLWYLSGGRLVRLDEGLLGRGP